MLSAIPRFSGAPFETQIGVGKVIKGWDEGALLALTGDLMGPLIDLFRCSSTVLGAESNVDRLS